MLLMPASITRAMSFIIAGVPKRTDVASDEEEDDAAAVADSEAGNATDAAPQPPGTPTGSPAPTQGGDKDADGDATAGVGSPEAATPRRSSALKRWSWMDGGDAGQPPDTGNSIEPPAQEDQASAPSHWCRT